MQAPLDPKQLKKLADECRKAGITSFKGYGVEFTLSEEAPVSRYKAKKAQAGAGKKVYHQGPEEPETEDLTEEQLLFYSVGGGIELALNEPEQN